MMEERTVVYNGFQLSDPYYWIGLNEICTSYITPPASKTFLYPTEYNIYGANSSIPVSYIVDAYGAWQKNYKIFDHLGSVRTVVRSDGMIVGKYDYEPFGEKLELSEGKDRLNFISKEKDNESNLGDFGVRKYDLELGRFTSCDPLWEKYYDWTPYQYTGNNPVTRYDDNGKWVKEISKEWHAILSRFFTPNIDRNSNGYLANQINNVFYEKWTESAPQIAEFIKSNNTFVIQTKLPNDIPAIADFKGDLVRFDLAQSEHLESETIHEIAHLMGATEYQAYASQYASGTLSKDDIIIGLSTSENYNGFNKHFRKGIPSDIRRKYFDGYGYLTMDVNQQNEFFNLLKEEGDKWIK